MGAGGSTAIATAADNDNFTIGDIVQWKNPDPKEKEGSTLEGIVAERIDATHVRVEVNEATAKGAVLGGSYLLLQWIFLAIYKAPRAIYVREGPDSQRGMLFVRTHPQKRRKCGRKLRNRWFKKFKNFSPLKNPNTSSSSSLCSPDLAIKCQASPRSSARAAEYQSTS